MTRISSIYACTFLPAAVLSAASPTVVKLQLHHLGQTGTVVGRYSAIGTTGASYHNHDDHDWPEGRSDEYGGLSDDDDGWSQGRSDECDGDGGLSDDDGGGRHAAHAGQTIWRARPGPGP